jgi:hypothetical protein
MKRSSPETSLRRCSLAALEAQITELAGQLNAANYRWLTLIGEFDRRQGWADGSLHSCAHWLNFKCGLDLGAAREKVRVASALPGVPKIAAAMKRGELSYSKVRALTRVATPATEENLLMIALHGTAYHVEKVVRLFRRAQEAEELSREAQQQAGRAVEYWYDTDGSLVLKARLPALAGGLLVKALEVALEAVPATELNVEFAEEQPMSYASRRADALARVAEGYLQNPVDSAETAPSGSTADRFQVVVHVDAETLKDQTAGRCHLEHGPALPAATVRRLTCDASLIRMVETERGEPLDVGRKTRSIPPAIRRALNARDPECCFPGCTSALSGCPPCRALGRGRGDQAEESGASMPHPSSAGARRRYRDKTPRRRRMALLEARWARVRRSGFRPGPTGLDGAARHARGVGHRDRQQHGGHALAGRADGLRTGRLGAVPGARTRAARSPACRSRRSRPRVQCRERRFRGNATGFRKVLVAEARHSLGHNCGLDSQYYVDPGRQSWQRADA